MQIKDPKTRESILCQMQDRLMSKSTYWGIQTLKCPVDFWVYQEILFSIKPNFVVEIGNFRGGSALAIAHIMDNLDKGQILAIDIDQSNIEEEAREHPRIDWIEGDAKACFQEVKATIPIGSTVLVIEDSSHEFDNTLSVLTLYSQLVSLGSYMIVEDSICHHGLDVGPSPGPYEAIEKFLTQTSDFEVDKDCEDFGITWNPNGYLRRVR
jgi:cephalosporin hydroxylase